MRLFGQFLGEVRLGPGPTRWGAGGTGPCCAHCANKCLRFDGLEELPRSDQGYRAGAVRDAALPTSENKHYAQFAE